LIISIVKSCIIFNMVCWQTLPQDDIAVIHKSKKKFVLKYKNK